MQKIQELGLVGAFTGGTAAASGGIAAAVFFGYIASLISKPNSQMVVNNLLETLNKMENNITTSITSIIDEKLEGMDDVVLELVRCKTENENLKNKVNELNKTNIPNLYAIGECASLYHGANRLGGNSLLSAIRSAYVVSNVLDTVENTQKAPDFKEFIEEQKQNLQKTLSQKPCKGTK